MSPIQREQMARRLIRPFTFRRLSDEQIALLHAASVEVMTRSTQVKQ